MGIGTGGSVMEVLIFVTLIYIAMVLGIIGDEIRKVVRILEKIDRGY